jgi:CRP/FNR family cyclic AMP-dependent transcriptional regulator
MSKSFARSFEKIGLFHGLNPESLARIQARCQWRNYEPGEVVLDYHDRSDDVFFVADGEVRAIIYSVDGKAVTFSDVSAGETFGEISALDGAPRSASIEAKTSCCVASMPRSAFVEVLKSEPQIAILLLEKCASRIRMLTNRVYEFSALDVANRTRAELLRLAQLSPMKGKNAFISPVPTHAEIASRISTHREAVTRELNYLMKQGLIERSEKTLVVKDIDRLAQLVEEAKGE